MGSGISVFHLLNEEKAMSQPIEKQFQDILFKEKRKQDLSFHVLSHVSNVSESTIFHYENGNFIPRLHIASKVLDFLGYELVIRRKK